VLCEPDVETHSLVSALQRIRGEICHEARVCGVPPLELEDILWEALLAVPEELDGRALERRLLAEVRKGLAAWRATMALWERRGAEFRRAMEEGGIPVIPVKDKLRKRGQRRR
jgi:hypothetical protein